MIVILASKNRKEIVISISPGKGLRTLPSSDSITNIIDKSVDTIMTYNGKIITIHNKAIRVISIIAGFNTII